MKIKRRKHCDKYLSFYRNNFGIREPYQIVADLTFCQAALQNRVQIKEQLQSYLNEDFKIYNTKCILAEGEKLGSRVHGALVISKTYETRNCGHLSALPADKCIKSFFNKGNTHGLFVATQDPVLRQDLRNKSGIPLLHVNHNVIVLEKPSTISVSTADQGNEEKLLTEFEKDILKQMKKDEEKPKFESIRKRKRARGPNPLSVMKKKKTDNKMKFDVNSKSVSGKKTRRRSKKGGHTENILKSLKL